MPIVGYARVSSETQSLDAQVLALREAGAVRIYQETISGAAKRRPQLARMLSRVGEGDTVIVTRLDRLARSTIDLMLTLDRLARKGVAFRSLADTWADTTTPHGRLMLTVLGGLAEFERDLIRARTNEGRSRARARGVHLGRPQKLTPHQRREAAIRRDAGLETEAEIARSYGVHRSTIGRLPTVPGDG
jgi:DNA invertase Pin-like site-specific DNA recombinase